MPQDALYYSAEPASRHDGRPLETVRLPFRSRPRSDLTVDEYVKRVDRRTLDETRAADKDYLRQTEAAVRAARVTRREITMPEAMAVVNLARRSTYIMPWRYGSTHEPVNCDCDLS